MRKTVTIFSLLVLVNIAGYFYSCNPCGKNSGPIENCFAIDSSFLHAYGKGGDTVVANEAVKWSDMRLGLTITYMNTSCCKPNINPFINYAYACDVAVITKYADSIVGLNIYSNKDFDDKHPAGTDLKEYFTGTDIAGVYTNYAPYNYSFILEQQPADTGTHTFTVQLELASGNSKISTAEPVQIIK